MLHVLARSWLDIAVNFLKISPVFTYCSTLDTNIPLEDDHVICFSRLWTIVDNQDLCFSFQFLIILLRRSGLIPLIRTSLLLLVISIIWFLIEALSLCQTNSRMGRQERESSWNHRPHTTLRQTVSQKSPTRQSSKPHDRARSKETNGYTNYQRSSSS